MTTDITTQAIKDHAESVYTYLKENVVGHPLRFFYSNNIEADNGYGDYVFHLVMNSSGNKLLVSYPLSYSETTAAISASLDPELFCRTMRQTLMYNAFSSTSDAYYDVMDFQSVPSTNSWAPSSDYPNLTELKIQTILGLPVVIHIQLNL